MDYFAISPHIIIEEGAQTRGAYVDYFNQHISPKLSKPIKWSTQQTPLARLLVSLKEGDISFIPFLLKRPDREKYLHYSKKPIMLTRPAILVRSDFPLKKITSFNDLKNFKIGFFQNGAIPDPIIKAGVFIQRVAGNDARQRMMVMLRYNRIDAIFDYQSLSLKFLKKKYTYPNGKVLILPLPDTKNYFVASKNSVSRDEFSEFEEALLSAPPYKEFVNKYIDNYEP